MGSVLGLSFSSIRKYFSSNFYFHSSLAHFERWTDIEKKTQKVLQNCQVN